MTWVTIGKIVWHQLFGKRTREADLNAQTKIVIDATWRLYEENKRLLESMKGNGHDRQIDEIVHREYDLMLRLMECARNVLYWKERAIFHEKENELLHMRLESKNSQGRNHRS